MTTLSDDEPMHIACTLPPCLVPRTDGIGKRLFVDVFVGCARLSSEFRKVGHPTFSMDVNISMDHDIRGRLLNITIAES